MTYVQLILLILKGLDKLTTFIHENKLRDEGETRAVLKGLRKADEKIKAAMAARAAADVANADPAKLREADGNKRPE